MRKAVFLWIMVMVVVLGCDTEYNQKPLVEKDEVLIKHQEKVRARTEANRAIFSRFVHAIQKYPGRYGGSGLHKLAEQFFPDSTIHNGYDLSAQEIPGLDTTAILLYEYSVPRKHTERHSYLGLFSPEGMALDVVPLKKISKDGSMTINRLGDQFVEIEYADFFPVSELFEKDHITDTQRNPNDKARLVAQKRKTAETAEMIFLYHYDTYRISRSGKWLLLHGADSIQLDRAYPLLSRRMLSDDELNELDAPEAKAMISEIYAGHGMIFSDPKEQARFISKDWYEPKLKSVDHLLNEIERMNIRRLLQWARSHEAL